eukprot:CAMPEP_0171369000 /NCGR_PEP_ID=MMETSP0879-20121228/7090_1 /TAXON_ID=67004 /ORGANISM="Thalassiosira weissflogii, Strain CCMP1336" /LENGTH=618 /DNA_ID=CAMNT_0011877261 /DNA_START=130 /DNA_END=1986 /DNA_ORIENTATION=-
MSHKALALVNRLDAAVKHSRRTGLVVRHAGAKAFSTSSSQFSHTKHQHYDVVIAGGGATGSALARLLLDDDYNHDNFTGRGKSGLPRPLKVALLEQRPSPPPLDELVEQQHKNATTPNARAYAISPTSLSYLGPSVLGKLIETNCCGVYDSMQVWEHDGPAQLHFVGEDLEGAINEGRLVNLQQLLNDSTSNKSTGRKNRPWLGAVIEDAPFVSAVWDELRKDDRIDLLDKIQVKSIKAPNHSDMGKIEPPPPVDITCVRKGVNDEGEEFTISSNLLVAADGANSFIRRTVGTFPMITRSYGRMAVTCTVELDTSKSRMGMARTAFQRFLPYGPIALLPVWNSVDSSSDREKESGPIYANVVWSTLPSEAKYLLSLSSEEFIAALNEYLCQGPNVNPSLLPDSNQPGGPPAIPLLSTIVREIDSLLRTANTALTMGTWTEAPTRNFFRMPPRSKKVVGPIMGFDLTMSHVATNGGYTSPRVALVGDAAHTMHPMAGQGLNLGMGDIHALASLIKEAVDSGMDVGGTNLFLDRYNEERILKGWGILGGVQFLHEAFECTGSIPGSITEHENATSVGSVGGLKGLIGYSRSLGMNAVNGIAPVRKALAEVAAGASPRLFP